MEMCGQLHVHAALPPGTHCIGVWVGRSEHYGEEKNTFPSPTGNRTPTPRSSIPYASRCKHETGAPVLTLPASPQELYPHANRADMLAVRNDAYFCGQHRWVETLLHHGIRVSVAWDHLLGQQNIHLNTQSWHQYFHPKRRSSLLGRGSIMALSTFTL
jgi:hypothetical protein